MTASVCDILARTKFCFHGRFEIVASLDMFRILALGMLCFHVIFVNVVIIRNAAYDICIAHYTSRRNTESHVSLKSAGVRVCNMDIAHPMDLFSGSVCHRIQGHNIHPSCQLNRALQAPYRILLGGVAVFAFISLTCFHLISHGLLINALTTLGL